MPPAVMPPSTAIAWPVRYDAASLARNTTAPAISSARAQRPIGTRAIIASLTSWFSHSARLRSVAVQPGQSALTRTPRLAHSIATDRVRLTTAALDAPYGVTPGDPPSPATAATLTTAPPRRAGARRRGRVGAPSRCRVRGGADRPPA